MSGYALAWAVIGIMGLGGGWVVWKLGQGMRSRSLRWSLVALSLAFFLLPAPIPNVADGIAPAFVVAVFELLFQIDGQPGRSVVTLVVGLAVIGVAGAVAMYREAAATPSRPASAEPVAPAAASVSEGDC